MAALIKSVPPCTDLCARLHVCARLHLWRRLPYCGRLCDAVPAQGRSQGDVVAGQRADGAKSVVRCSVLHLLVSHRHRAGRCSCTCLCAGRGHIPAPVLPRCGARVPVLLYPVASLPLHRAARAKRRADEAPRVVAGRERARGARVLCNTSGG